LRVIDGSMMPPQAMINAATIALAERASDLVLAG
jgi:choline dehydrogenase